MSIQAVAWVLEQDLPAKAKIVLISIANHADHANGYCWLRLETIGREASIPVRSLYRYIGALVRNGYLRKELRRGDDGKQRATDYWILFQRASAVWDWGAKASVGEEDDPLDVVEPSAILADGEITSEAAPEPVDNADLADGPSANGGRRRDEEPSKSKPSRESVVEGPALIAPVPRGYHPPPVEPEAYTGPSPSKRIFVIEGTRAWEAWKAHRGRTRGIHGLPYTTVVIDGKSKRGWWFDSLFPPAAARESFGSDPPKEPFMSEDDHREAANL